MALKELKIRLPEALSNELDWLGECCGLTGDQMASAVFVLQMRRQGDLTPGPALEADPDLAKCPRCGGPADNGHDREFPPNPYLCTKCHAALEADSQAYES